MTIAYRFPVGFEPVSSDAFYSAIGSLDVHPTPEGRHDHEWGYVSHWRTPSGTTVGLSVGGTHLQPRAYALKAGHP